MAGHVMTPVMATGRHGRLLLLILLILILLLLSVLFGDAADTLHLGGEMSNSGLFLLFK